MHIIIFSKKFFLDITLQPPTPKHKYWKEEVFKRGENTSQGLWEPFEKSYELITKRPSSTVGRKFFFPFRQVQNEI